MSTAVEPTCAALVVPPGCRRRWHGPCHRGHARCVRAAKRWEAALRATALGSGGCSHPHKFAYENRDSVRAALKRLKRRHKSADLQMYQCPAGHWHLGRRARKSTVVWRR